MSSLYGSLSIHPHVDRAERETGERLQGVGQECVCSNPSEGQKMF